MGFIDIVKIENKKINFKTMYPLIFIGGKILISATAKELAILSGTYLVSKCIKKSKDKKNKDK